MKTRRVNRTIRQWLLPIGILLVIISVLMLRFLVISREKEQTEVEGQILNRMESYAAEVRLTLDGIQKGADAVAVYIRRVSQEDVDTESALMAVCDTAGVYNAVICDKYGKGIRRNGQEIDLSGEDYFEDVLTGERKILYVADDGLDGRAAIIVVSPVRYHLEVEKYILCFYEPSRLEQTIKKMEFGTNAFHMMLDVNGQVVVATGNMGSSLCEKTSDYFSYLKQAADDAKEIDRLSVRMQNGNSDVTYLSNGKESKGIAYVPVGAGDFYLLAGIPESYINKSIQKEWSAVGSIMWQLIAALLLFVGIVVVINILTRIKENEKSRQLATKADTDLLTDLYNKAATEREIREYIAENPDGQGLMFVLDIDNFKKINDTMGHAFGDEVLRTLGMRIKAEFRASDIVGRTGGDEFTIFLCNIKEDDVIRSEAKRVERFFHDFQAGEYVKYSATASIGAAIFPRDAASFEGLYRAADQALYVAKKRGKNQLAFYGDDK